MTNTPINVKVLDARLSELMPSYGTEGSAGMDLRACLSEQLVLQPGQCELIPTGFAMSIENPSIGAMILPRSGLGHKQGLVLGNLVGLIDSDYQGPLMISAWNRSVTPVTIQPMDRIAQLVFVPIIKAQLNIVDSFDSTTERAEGGFGSTGKS